jgi:hypothetical protein
LNGNAANCENGPGDGVLYLGAAGQIQSMKGYWTLKRPVTLTQVNWRQRGPASATTLNGFAGNTREMMNMLVRATGIEPVRACSRDFKSLASTSFATPAVPLHIRHAPFSVKLGAEDFCWLASTEKSELRKNLSNPLNAQSTRIG